MRKSYEIVTVETESGKERPAIYGPRDQHYMYFLNNGKYKLVEVFPMIVNRFVETAKQMYNRRSIKK